MWPNADSHFLVSKQTHRIANRVAKGANRGPSALTRARQLDAFGDNHDREAAPMLFTVGMKSHTFFMVNAIFGNENDVRAARVAQASAIQPQSRPVTSTT